MGVPIFVNHAHLEENARVVETGLQKVENGIPPDIETITSLDQVNYPGIACP